MAQTEAAEYLREVMETCIDGSFKIGDFSEYGVLFKIFQLNGTITAAKEVLEAERTELIRELRNRVALRTGESQESAEYFLSSVNDPKIADLVKRLIEVNDAI